MKKKNVVRTGLLAGAVVLGLAGPASAFECYNASRSSQGNASAAASPALASVEEFLSGFVGLCPAGVDVVVDGLHAEGFETDMLITPAP